MQQGDVHKTHVLFLHVTYIENDRVKYLQIVRICILICEIIWELKSVELQAK